MKIIAITAVAVIVLPASPGFAQSTPDSTKQPTQSLKSRKYFEAAGAKPEPFRRKQTSRSESEPSRGHQAGRAEPKPL